MSGLEIFGALAAGISLLAQTYNGCVLGLQLISKARHSGESLLDFSTRLDLETAQLVIWGRNSGLARGELDHSLVSVQPLLLQILTKVVSGIESTETLKSTYGIVLIEDPQTEISRSRSRSQSRGVDSLDILSIAELSGEVEKQARKVEMANKHLSPFQRFKWAAWDEEKANRFVDSIKGYVDGLNQLLTESQKAALDAETTAMRIAILGTDWSQPLRMLQVLETATTGRYEAIALPARLLRFRLELEMEAVAPLPPEGEPRPAQELQISDEHFRAFDANHSRAILQDSDILVEWRVLSAVEAVGESGRVRTKQVARLASLFKELIQQPADYRVLDCVGFLDQRRRVPPRLGVAFALSISASGGSVQGVYSLHDYLSSKTHEDFQPDLGSRFELARKLTRGFLQFHQLGWLHKDIRCHNIIFLSEDGTSTIESPYIIGFAYSRPVQEGVSDKKAPGEELLGLYCHPEYHGKPAVPFRLEYDLFSIGLLLFEIAKWRPLENYWHRLRKTDKKLSVSKFVEQLLKTEGDDLEFRMGTSYKSAVVTCLTNSFDTKENGAQSKQVKLAFFEKVVKTLDSCRA